MWLTPSRQRSSRLPEIASVALLFSTPIRISVLQTSRLAIWAGDDEIWGGGDDCHVLASCRPLILSGSCPPSQSSSWTSRPSTSCFPPPVLARLTWKSRELLVQLEGFGHASSEEQGAGRSGGIVSVSSGQLSRCRNGRAGGFRYAPRAEDGD